MSRPHASGDPQDQSLRAALSRGVVVLDGGLATELERAGHDVSGTLWSAALLRDDPGAIVEAHSTFVAAGAQVVTTASYQATFEGLASQGVDRDEAQRLLRLSVELGRWSGARWVAASVGPYGAMLADGSEYTGAYAEQVGLAGLRRFHRERLAVLAEAGPDVIACETVPSALEAQALLAELDGLGVPAWLSLTTVTTPDGRVVTRLGEEVAAVAAQAAATPEVVAVGVNCTDPAGVGAAVAAFAQAAPGLAVVVYPNSGETWDGAARSWRGSPDWRDDDVLGWVDAGARLVGGCCRVGPDQVRALADLVGSADRTG